MEALKSLTKFAALALISCGVLASTKAQIYEFESGPEGFNTKSFFYDTGEEIVAIDSQFTPALTQESIKFLRTKTDRPISHVLLTHPNPDKFNGIKVFQDLGAKVIASDKTKESMKGVHEYKKYFFVQMAKMFTEETYPKLSSVDESFEDSKVLKLKNGEEIKLIELNQAGVSSNQTVISIPKVNALFVGDLVHHKAHAWLEGGVATGRALPQVQSWIKVLDSLKKRFPESTTVYGGRGENVRLAQGVKGQINYLQSLDKIVSETVKRVGKEEVAKNGYELIVKEAVKKFPDYDLSYMIQYGVYGLVNSK